MNLETKSHGCWIPISNAPKEGCNARDAAGVERWSWIDRGEWVYEKWIKNNSGEDCLCFIPWAPVEYEATVELDKLPSKCRACGWTGNSDQLIVGDHDDQCPNCGSVLVEETE